MGKMKKINFYFLREKRRKEKKRKFFNKDNKKGKCTEIKFRKRSNVFIFIKKKFKVSEGM